MNTVIPFPRAKPPPPAPVTFEQLRGRLGRFAIPDAWVQEYPSIALEIMSQVVVLRAGHCSYGGHEHTIYIAISALFDLVPDSTPGDYEWVQRDGCMVPIRFPGRAHP